MFYRCVSASPIIFVTVSIVSFIDWVIHSGKLEPFLNSFKIAQALAKMSYVEQQWIAWVQEPNDIYKYHEINFEFGYW